MLKSTMQKKPQTITAQFNAVFTTRTLIMIIGALLGIITARALGIY